MQRLLVIRFSALGDVAMLVPVVRALAEQYSDLQITVLSQPKMADLFIGLPANVVFKGVDIHQQPLRTIIHDLGSYDAVADIHDVWRSRYIRWAMCLRGVRVRTISKPRIGAWRLIHNRHHPALAPRISLYMDVLRQLGYFISLPEAPQQTTGKGIGIAPFAAHEGKMYPLPQMEQVVRSLSTRGEKIVLFGSKQEKELLDSWAQKYPNVENIAGKYSLVEEMDLMRHLRVMVTMDSANMHLASFVGTRVVSLWGATHPKAGFLGFGQKERDCIQLDLPCRPCSIYGKKKCRYGDYRCWAIEPEKVIDRIYATD